MKIVELLNDIRIPITNEESDVLQRFDGGKLLTKKDLEPREQILVDSLVRKDIIRRQNNNGQITYSKKIRSTQENG